MRAMILAAGYGTRLFPLTADRAKPALPFLNRPLVGYVAEYLARFGVHDCVVNLHHQGDSVRRALGDGSRFGVRTHFIEEPEILGTSGALDNARHLLEGDTFIAINGKIVTNINLALALETHRRTNALATLILRRNVQRERFSIVETDGEQIMGFGGTPPHASDNDLEVAGASELDSELEHKLAAATAPPLIVPPPLTTPLATVPLLTAPLMFTGIQILEPRIFDYIPRQRFSHSTTDVYPPAINNGERIVAHIAEGDWYELSTLERYLDISLELWKKQSHHSNEEQSKPTPDDALMTANEREAANASTSNIVGADSEIESGAQVEEAILWERVHVERGARVRRSVLGDGVRVRAGEQFINSIVVRGELVSGIELPPKALRGEFIGGNFVVPLTG